MRDRNAPSEQTGEEGSGKKFVDTRIHWGSSDEGWLGTGGPATDFSSWDGAPTESQRLRSYSPGVADPFLGTQFEAADSHYRYLGLTPDADAEEVKAAYRKLSKTYHPDSTSLPLEIAAQKFMRLKEAYTVLSSEEERRMYDWQLAQEIAKQRPATPYWQEDQGEDGRDPFGSKDVVDRLAGGNLELSDQAKAALAFDMFALVVSIISIAFALFKQSRM